MGSVPAEKHHGPTRELQKWRCCRGSGKARARPGAGPALLRVGGEAACEPEDCTWRLGPNVTGSCLTAPIWIFVRGGGENRLLYDT